MAQLDHERLDAYQVAMDFVALANDVEHSPRARGHLADQLQRASLSVALNIAEALLEQGSAPQSRVHVDSAGASRRRIGNGNGNEPQVRRSQTLTLND